MSLVSIDDLSYTYGGSSAAVLRHCSLSVDPGEMVLVVGPSGCGKSTLLRAINGLVPHFYGGTMAGRASVAGIDTRNTSPSALAHLVGCVFQDPEAQLVTSTVFEEVVFGLENLGVRPDRIALRAHEALAAMGAAHLAERSTRSLSGGEAQRVAIAAVLAMRPKVLVLDEPTSQLDPAAAESLLELLRRVNEESGIAVVIAEHRLERCFHWADRVVVMADGEILSDATPRESARWTLAAGGAFVPPVTRLFADVDAADCPLTVKEGRAALARLAPAASAAIAADAGDSAVVAGAQRARNAPAVRTRLPWPFGRAARASAGGLAPALEVRGARYSYDDGTEALRGCGVAIAAGEVVAIMGTNGAGKSTLVRHFNGLLRGSGTTLALDGSDVTDLHTEQLAARVAVLGQNPDDQLFRDSVEAELRFTLDNVAPHLAPEAATERITQTLELLGIAELASAEPRRLSAGQRMRVAVAALMVGEPSVLALDEPTRGLDWESKTTLGHHLRRVAQQGVAVVVVTHDVEFAATFTDRAVVMAAGRIVADGPTPGLMSETTFLAPQVSRVLSEHAHGVVTVEAGRDALAEVLAHG
jgi:energy-coupling factor transport system ATP-binding protein